MRLVRNIFELEFNSNFFCITTLTSFTTTFQRDEAVITRCVAIFIYLEKQTYEPLTRYCVSWSRAGLVQSISNSLVD